MEQRKRRVAVSYGEDVDGEGVDDEDGCNWGVGKFDDGSNARVHYFLSMTHCFSPLSKYWP